MTDVKKDKGLASMEVDNPDDMKKEEKKVQLKLSGLFLLLSCASRLNFRFVCFFRRHHK
jgi:hypothetical protein